MRDGERKAIANERVALVPGESEEVQTIRDIFELFADQNMREGDIAVQLNHSQVSAPGGGKWTERSIRLILQHEIYTGSNVYNRHTQRLHTPTRKNPREKWVIIPGAYEAIVSPEMFVKAQEMISRRHPTLTDQEVIGQLRNLFENHGKLTGLIIESAQGQISTSTLRRRFGSLINAYRLVGWEPPHDYRFIELKELVAEFEQGLVERLIESLNKMGMEVADHGTHFMINEQLNVQVIASSVRNSQGRKKWAYKFDRSCSIDIIIAVRLMDNKAEERDYYILPMIAMETDRLLVAWTNGISLDIFRFDNLDYFYDLFGDATLTQEEVKKEAEDAQDSGTSN